MNFYKILNPINKFDQYDYKGLNTELFIPGSLVYSYDNSMVLFATTEENIQTSSEIILLNEVDYDSLKQSIEASNAQVYPPTVDLVKNLQVQNAQMLNQLNLLPPVANPTTLKDYQQNKIYELNTACNKDILAGFSSLVLGESHQYKFDMEYQANMAQEGMMLALDQTITSVDWPTVDAGVVAHTRDQFIQLCKDAKQVKETKLYRYFSMKVQVLDSSITTIDQVKAFTW